MGIIRLFFAFSVLLGHININVLPPPMYAVQGFYIVSGFYMSMILNEKYPTHDLNIVFYKKRLLKLLPTYWLISVAALFIALIYACRGESNILFFDFNNFPIVTSITTNVYLFFSNIFIWGQDLALFLGISPETGDMFFSVSSFAEEYPMLRYMLIPVSWSVSSEFTFYLIAPFILRKKQKIVFILFIISLMSNVVTNYYGLNDSNWRFRFFPSILLYFLTGYWVYLIYSKFKAKLNLYKLKYLFVFLYIVIVTLFIRLEIPYAIKTVFLLLMSLTFIPYIFNSFKTSKYDRIIGEMSYPLYLIHPLFIGLNELLNINNAFFVIFASLGGSYCIYIYFIKRIEIIRDKIGYSSIRFY